MKTYLKLVGGAVLIGGILAYLFYHDINKEVIALENTENNLYLFQVGVFSNYDNALNFAPKYSSNIIYQADNFYRVLTCATINNKDKMAKYYDENNVNYYIKKVTINDNFKKELINSDELLAKTNEKEAITKLCQNELDIFVSYAQK